MTFKETVLAMSAKDIIMNMVEGLRHPSLKVRMNMFGQVIDGVCFGCAATNAVCQISGKTFTEGNIVNRLDRSIFIEVDYEFLSNFEEAMDRLRCGLIHNYNYIAKIIGLATISNSLIFLLPHLYDDYTDEELQIYMHLANSQL